MKRSFIRPNGTHIDIVENGVCVRTVPNNSYNRNKYNPSDEMLRDKEGLLILPDREDKQ